MLGEIEPSLALEGNSQGRGVNGDLVVAEPVAEMDSDGMQLECKEKKG